LKEKAFCHQELSGQGPWGRQGIESKNEAIGGEAHYFIVLLECFIILPTFLE